MILEWVWFEIFVLFGFIGLDGEDGVGVLFVVRLDGLDGLVVFDKLDVLDIFEGLGKFIFLGGSEVMVVVVLFFDGVFDFIGIISLSFIFVSVFEME